MSERSGARDEAQAKRNDPGGADGPALLSEDARHRRCWYSRRTPQLPPDIGQHTIADGLLLYCVHPMLFPIVGYQFDVRNCNTCDYFKPLRVNAPQSGPAPR